MCYSNCKNEDCRGDCKNDPSPYDIEVHCFMGFVCRHCSEIFPDDSELSGTDNVCKDCEEHFLFDKGDFDLD